MLVIQILIMLGLTVAQNASFTLVSRARNSKSLLYHGLAAIGSNGIWVLVFRHLSLNLSNNYLLVAYVIGAVSGSILMHWFAMKFLEKPRVKKAYEDLTAEEVEWVKINVAEEQRSCAEFLKALDNKIALEKLKEEVSKGEN